MLVEEAPDGLLSPKTQSSFSKLVYSTPPPQGLKRKLDFDDSLSQTPVKKLFNKEYDTDVAASSDDEYFPEKDSFSLLSSPIPVSRTKFSFDKNYKTSTPRKRTSDRIEKKATITTRGAIPVNIVSPPIQVPLDIFLLIIHSSHTFSYYVYFSYTVDRLLSDSSLMMTCLSSFSSLPIIIIVILCDISIFYIIFE